MSCLDNTLHFRNTLLYYLSFFKGTRFIQLCLPFIFLTPLLRNDGHLLLTHHQYGTCYQYFYRLKGNNTISILVRHSAAPPASFCAFARSWRCPAAQTEKTESLWSLKDFGLTAISNHCLSQSFPVI